MDRNKYWRQKKAHSAENLVRGVFQDYPATRIFDNIYFIGNDMMACYLIDTSEGLILLDCMERGFFQYIDDSIRSLDFDPSNLKAILITHGHADHYGDANIFREKYGTKLYMSKVDEENFWDPNLERKPRPGINYRMDGYLVGGENFKLGDTTIQIYDTPGHTPGCCSFIFTGYDNGVPVKLSLWGGTGAPLPLQMREKQLASIDYFDACCAKENVAGELSNHPFTNCTVERLNLLRNIVDGVSHPFIIGYGGVRQMNLMYRDSYIEALSKTEEELRPPKIT